MKFLNILCFLALIVSSRGYAGGGSGVVGGLQIALLENQYEELVTEIVNGMEVDIIIPSKDLLAKSNELIELDSAKITMKSSVSEIKGISITKTKENENSQLFLEANKVVIEVSVAE